ncbi:hypothetical protein [Streptomyces vinaceus]|uniref:hypothetical protein n=1 Tax=Streptomyces vinaceus TaxID=1960 RepID=UPI00368D2B13
MSDTDLDNESADTGTFATPTSSLRKNGHVVLMGRPCQITEMSTSDNKTKLVGHDLITGTRCEETLPADGDAVVPNVIRTDYTLVSLAEDGYLVLDNAGGTSREDIKLPAGDLGKQIEAGVDSGTDLIVSVLRAMDEEAVVGVRESATR